MPVRAKGVGVSKKYLFVINSFGAGGAERSLLELLPEFVGNGITPIIACLSYQDIGFEEEVREAGFDVRFMPEGGRTTKIMALRRLIKDERPNLIYTSLFEADLAGRVASYGLSVPVMTCLVNTAYDPARLEDPNLKTSKLKFVQAIDGFTARHLTDHFHAISDAVKDSTVETMRVQPDKITVVKRGRDVDRLGRASAERRERSRRMLELDEASPVAVTVGRQEYQKGQRYLIEAFAGVVKEIPQARLLIVGRQGHFTERLHAKVDELDMGDAITFLGHRADVPEILAASDVFVFPSLYEGLGGALIEAIALSLPVVASDIPALREVVSEGENAILVAPRDVAGLEKAIVKLLGDDDLRLRYGQRSRELFEAEFKVEDASRSLMKLLTEIST